MLKKMIFFFWVLFTVSGCVQKAANTGKTQVKPSLPAFSLNNAEGGNLDLSSLKGKRVFVNLWATWCPPCVAEMPSIQELYNKSKPENAAFVLIALDNNFETAKNWMRQKQFTVPIYNGNVELPELFQVQGIPTTFIFDEKGELIFRGVGSEDYASNRFIKLLSGK